MMSPTVTFGHAEFSSKSSNPSHLGQGTGCHLGQQISKDGCYSQQTRGGKDATVRFSTIHDHGPKEAPNEWHNGHQNQKDTHQLPAQTQVLKDPSSVAPESIGKKINFCFGGRSSQISQKKEQNKQQSWSGGRTSLQKTWSFHTISFQRNKVDGNWMWPQNFGTALDWFSSFAILFGVSTIFSQGSW